MQKRVGIRAFALVLMMLFIAGSALAENGAIRTYLTFRITTRTQSAVVNVGEDLQIEVGVSGVEPTSWQWYFKGEPIEQNGDQRIYNLLNATEEDAGLKAYKDDTLVVSVDVNVRVIEPVIMPASGDGSMPVAYAFAALAMGMAALVVLGYKRRHA
jgi:hypothetical protein